MANTPAAHEARLTLLDQLAAQQLRRHDPLSEVTARLSQEHALHAERLALDEAILASVAQTLAAIEDMRGCGNGH